MLIAINIYCIKNCTQQEDIANAVEHLGLSLIWLGDPEEIIGGPIPSRLYLTSVEKRASILSKFYPQ